MNLETLSDILMSNAGSVADLDRAVWAYMTGRDYPLDPASHEDWYRDVGTWAGAELVSNTNNIFSLMQKEWDSHRLDMDVLADNVSASIILSSKTSGMGVSGKCRMKGTILDSGKCLALAFVEAREKALYLDARIARVAGLVVPDMNEWPVEEMPDGSFAQVLHSHQLCGLASKTAQSAVDHVSLNHKGDYGLMLCRERYLKLFQQDAGGVAKKER